jgi:3-oxoacyl-[acyl-carrier-protein] synthase-3
MKNSLRDTPPRYNRTASIIGTGSYVPERVLTNADLESMVETNHQWIVERTGIYERRIAAENEFTSHMAAKAAQAAMENAGVTPEEIDMILVATITPDMFFPSTACQVQRQIGAKNATCMDVNAACSGFLYCVEIANQFISNHGCNTVLVIGADKLSSIVNWEDRNTCVLFGDGAGAAILRHRPGSKGIVATHMGSDGNYGDILHMPGGGCALPITRENVDDKLNTLQMNGRETFKQAVTSMMRAANTVLDRCGLTAQDIKCVIPTRRISGSSRPWPIAWISRWNAFTSISTNTATHPLRRWPLRSMKPPARDASKRVIRFFWWSSAGGSPSQVPLSSGESKRHPRGVGFSRGPRLGEKNRF